MKFETISMTENGPAAVGLTRSGRDVRIVVTDAADGLHKFIVEIDALSGTDFDDRSVEFELGRVMAETSRYENILREVYGESCDTCYEEMLCGAANLIEGREVSPALVRMLLDSAAIEAFTPSMSF